MDQTIGYVLAGLMVATIALIAMILVRTARAERRAAEDCAQLEALARELGDSHQALDEMRSGMTTLAQHARTSAALDQERHDALARSAAQATERTDALRRELTQQLIQNREATEARLAQMTTTTDARLSEVRAVVDRQLAGIRTDTAAQLDRMRATVDEKLQQTLNDRITQSFQLVNDRLQQVDKGLGEMQALAAGVGDLKRVLGNVKTRGTLGEVQLGAILRDILPAELYVEQASIGRAAATGEKVDAAVKLPVRDGDPVWLPIDAKFPGDTYERLRDALDTGDADAVAAARKTLETVLKNEARSIGEKYISVPETTNFAILFLPFEGLYAEAVDRPGLIEALQRDYQVNIAGPSTMAAILNSLMMSYQTFAFQQRADEIQRILQAVKAEFPKYQKALQQARGQIDRAGSTIDTIMTTRTNVIQRKLSQITALDDEDEAARVLGLGPGSREEAQDGAADPEESEE